MGDFYLFTIMTQNTPSDLKIEQENSKKLCFDQILNHSLNFEPLLLLLSELNLKFHNATLCVLYRSMFSQNFVLNLVYLLSHKSKQVNCQMNYTGLENWGHLHF